MNLEFSLSSVMTTRLTATAVMLVLVYIVTTLMVWTKYRRIRTNLLNGLECTVIVAGIVTGVVAFSTVLMLAMAAIITGQWPWWYYH